MALGFRLSTFWEALSIRDWIIGRRSMSVPVGCCRNELCDCVSEGRLGIYVEDRVRVFAVKHATGGKDDGDEVYACVFKKRGRT